MHVSYSSIYVAFPTNQRRLTMLTTWVMIFLVCPAAGLGMYQGFFVSSNRLTDQVISVIYYLDIHVRYNLFHDWYWQEGN